MLSLPNPEADRRFVAAAVSELTAWLSLVEAERCEASKATKDALRKPWLDALSQVLITYAIWPTTLPFPMGLAWRLGRIVEHLSVGDVPHAFDVRSDGRTTPALLEREDMRKAVCYEMAAKAGLVDDPNPRRTLERWYDIHEDTLRGWIRKFKSGITLEKLRESDPGAIVLLAMDGGHRYQQIGRGAKAIKRSTRQGGEK
jgi:hypothetical protein